MEKRTKILLEHVPHSLNYGTTMMAINFINFFKDKNVDIFLDTQNIEDISRLKESCEYSNIYKDSFFKRRKNKFIRIFYKLFIQPFVLRKYDYIFILGGDDLSEYYGRLLFFINALSMMMYSQKRKRLFLLGQSVGPFTGINKLIAKILIKNSNLYTRDTYCSEYLRNNLKINYFKEMKDLAFLDLPFQKNERIDILNKYNLEESKYISIVPSGLYKSYTLNYNTYLKNWIQVIETLLENYPKEKILLLAHVVSSDSSSDINIIEDIYSSISFEKRKQIVKIITPILPVEARYLLGNSIYTITGRMHAAVSTFQMYKPAISLSYSIKYKGVIGDLGRSDLIIEASNNSIWEKYLVKEKILDKIKYLKENYTNIIKEIKESIDITKKEVEKNLNEIKEILKRSEK